MGDCRYCMTWLAFDNHILGSFQHLPMLQIHKLAEIISTSNEPRTSLTVYNRILHCKEILPVYIELVTRKYVGGVSTIASDEVLTCCLIFISMLEIARQSSCTLFLRIVLLQSAVARQALRSRLVSIGQFQHPRAPQVCCSRIVYVRYLLIEAPVRHNQPYDVHRAGISDERDALRRLHDRE